jgi:hypothetical protein
MDTGIYMDDVIQTLIDLRLAHTGASNIEMNSKKQEGRDQRPRRRQKSNTDHDQCDNNNNSTAILTIDEDLLHTNLARLSNTNVLTKNDQHIFYPKYLRLINRR